MITLTVDMSRLTMRMKRVADYITTRPQTVMTETIIRGIRERSARGIDANGIPFSSYSEGHARRRKRLGLQTARKDLRMNITRPPLLDSLYVHEGGVDTITVDAGHGAIAVGLAAQGARFIAANDEDLRTAEQQVQREMAKL